MKPALLMFALGVTLMGMNYADTSEKEPVTAVTSQATSNDPFLWLEDIHGDRSMAWVKKENARTTKQFIDNAEFNKSRSAILQVLDSEARIPYVKRMGNYLYNFWQDKTNPRGIWRRTTLDEYRKADPKWETVLDIDALNKAENKKWVFKGAQCMKPEYIHCLVSLSPGGGDAVEVREFDLPTKSFVKDGFSLPVAKSSVSWIDADHTLRRHRFRSRLDDQVQLSAHRQGMDPRHTVVRRETDLRGQAR